MSRADAPDAAGLTSVPAISGQELNLLQAIHGIPTLRAF